MPFEVVPVTEVRGRASALTVRNLGTRIFLSKPAWQAIGEPDYVVVKRNPQTRIWRIEPAAETDTDSRPIHAGVAKTFACLPLVEVLPRNEAVQVEVVPAEQGASSALQFVIPLRRPL